MIDPNINLPPGSGAFIPPVGPDSTGGPTTVPLLTDPMFITDTSGPASGPPISFALQAPSTIVLPLPEITLNQFVKTVTGALNTLRDTIFAAENQNNMTLRNMHLNALVMAAELAALYSKARSLITAQEQLYSTLVPFINDINVAIDTYNTGVRESQPFPSSDHIETLVMNNAIAQFNAGTLSLPGLIFFINEYNEYANERNPVITPFLDAFNTAVNSYNAQLPAINAQIENVNSLRDDLDVEGEIPLLPNLDNVTPLPLMTPPPGVGFLIPFLPDRVFADPVALPPPPPTPEQIVDTAFTVKFNEQIPPTIAFSDYLEIITKYREFIQFVIESRVKTQPNGYIEPLPAVFFNSAAGATAGAGVALGSISVNLDTRGLEKILGAAMYQAATTKFGLPLPARLVASLVLTSLETLSVSGLLATIPAMRLVANKLPFINVDKSASDVFLGLAYSNRISNFIASDDHLLTIQGFVSDAFPGLDSARINQLSSALSAGVNLSLLQFATFQLSQTLGIPGLSAQLLANSSGQPVQDIIQEFSGPSTTQDVFQNSLSVASLKADLARQLIASGERVEAEANSLINTALNKTIAEQGIQSAQALQASLIRNLRNQGVAVATATELAAEAASFIKAESIGLYLLDTELKRDLLSKRILADRLTAEGIDAGVASNAISKILAEEAKSLRGLRDRVANELVSQNVRREEALIAATKAVIGDQNINAIGALPASLSEHVAQRVVALLTPTLGSFDAQKIANQLNLTLFGPTAGDALVREDLRRPNSITSQLRDQVRVLENLQNEDVQASVREIFREFNKPNFDLYTFNRRLMDPANTLIHSMWTGAMYKGQGDFPSNFQQTIDVII